MVICDFLEENKTLQKVEVSKTQFPMKLLK